MRYFAISIFVAASLVAATTYLRGRRASTRRAMVRDAGPDPIVAADHAAPHPVAALAVPDEPPPPAKPAPGPSRRPSTPSACSVAWRSAASRARCGAVVAWQRAKRGWLRRGWTGNAAAAGYGALVAFGGVLALGGLIESGWSRWAGDALRLGPARILRRRGSRRCRLQTRRCRRPARPPAALALVLQAHDRRDHDPGDEDRSITADRALSLTPSGTMCSKATGARTRRRSGAPPLSMSRCTWFRFCCSRRAGGHRDDRCDALL